LKALKVLFSMMTKRVCVFVVLAIIKSRIHVVHVIHVVFQVTCVDICKYYKVALLKVVVSIRLFLHVCSAMIEVVN